MSRFERGSAPDAADNPMPIEDLFELERKRRDAEEGLFRFLLAGGVDRQGQPDRNLARLRMLLRGMARDAVDETPDAAWHEPSGPGAALADALVRVAHRNSKGRVASATLSEARDRVLAVLPAVAHPSAELHAIVPPAAQAPVLPNLTFAQLIRESGCSEETAEVAARRAASAFETVLCRIGLAEPARADRRAPSAESVAEEFALRWTRTIEGIFRMLGVAGGPDAIARLLAPALGRIRGIAGPFATNPAEERFRIECFDQAAWESLRRPVFLALEGRMEGRILLPSRGISEIQLENGLVRYWDALHREWSRTRLLWIDPEGRLRVRLGYIVAAILKRLRRDATLPEELDRSEPRQEDHPQDAIGRVEARKRDYAARFAAWAAKEVAADVHLRALLAASKDLLPWPLEPALERCRDALPKTRARVERKSADPGEAPELIPDTLPNEGPPRAEHVPWRQKAEELEERIARARASLRRLREEAADAWRAPHRAAWIEVQCAAARETLALGEEAGGIRRAGELLRALAGAPGAGSADAGLAALLGEYWMVAARKPASLPDGLGLDEALALAREWFRTALEQLERGGPASSDGGEPRRRFAPLLARLGAVEFGLGQEEEADARFADALAREGDPFAELAGMIAALRFDTDLAPDEELRVREAWAAVRAANARWALHPRGGNHKGTQRACESLLEGWRKEVDHDA